MPKRSGGLTPRQYVVVEAVAQGQTTAQAAVTLGITVQTVKNHLHDAFKTNGVANVRELIWALGWVKPLPPEALPAGISLDRLHRAVQASGMATGNEWPATIELLREYVAAGDVRRE